MSYFQARSDLKFIKDFKQDVSKLWRIEDQTAKKIRDGDFDSYDEYQTVLQAIASEVEGYTDVRNRVAKGVLSANRIATRLRIPFILIEASGFDVSKVEDHFLGRIFKLFEIGIILYVLLKLGFEKETLQQFLLKLF